MTSTSIPDSPANRRSAADEITPEVLRAYVAEEGSLGKAVPGSLQRRGRRMTHMTPGRAALLGLMHRYLGALMDPFITLLEAHKLMYFLQEAGEPLRLRFVKAPLNPFAEDLRHALGHLEGYLIAVDEAGVVAPGEHLSLGPGAVSDAERFLAEHVPTRERFDRVARLVEGFETPFGLELLASVHWVLSRESVKSQDGLVDALYAWGPRQRQFSPMQVGLAADRLRQEGWLP